jgi:hypothetical protein
MYGMLLIGYTMELYPTALKGYGLGITCSFGKLGNINIKVFISCPL